MPWNPEEKHVRKSRYNRRPILGHASKIVYVNLSIFAIRIMNKDEDDTEKVIAVDLCQAACFQDL
ncbi:hypothetical protein EDD18DRAFT_1464619 [Armillaria luteobubalina]|uniref:Uncharacterized protein n=1 Tax=Armillaria luteobubalina TaxID=153913 RepID=A0AA39Q077_9AGAR|nr:hypothetical protein EDD18DRAFT_1464619 [Armillaria luteobubalina]